MKNYLERILLVFLLFSSMKSYSQQNNGGVNITTDSLTNYLIDNIHIINHEISNLKKNDIDILKSTKNEFPKLDSLQGIKIDMHYDSIITKIGEPNSIDELGNTIVISYNLSGDKILKIGIDKTEDSVIYIITDSFDISIPNNLTIGMGIEKYEKIYGSRRYRKTKRISIDHDLIIYPFSNLSLVIGTEHRIVNLLMVSKN